MGLRGGFALLTAAAVMVVAAPAGASMQLVSVTDPTPAKTFVALHGLNSSPERDLITASVSGADVVITDDVGISSFPAVCTRLQPTSVSCPFSAYDDISMRTGPGNDVFTSTIAAPNLTPKQIFGPTVSVYVNGVLGPGNDHFTGGGATDAINGGPGRDRLNGGGGNDLLVGAGGNDLLLAGPGLDNMSGGKGRDVCVARGGRDRVGGCKRVRVR